MIDLTEIERYKESNRLEAKRGACCGCGRIAGNNFYEFNGSRT